MALPSDSDGSPDRCARSRGRPKGSPNKLSGELRQQIIDRYKPHEFIGRVALGMRIRLGPQAGPGKAEYVYPSIAQRMEAAQILLSKTLPDLKSSEITGNPDAPLSIEARSRITDEDKVDIVAMVAERQKLDAAR